MWDTFCRSYTERAIMLNTQIADEEGEGTEQS